MDLYCKQNILNELKQKYYAYNLTLRSVLSTIIFSVEMKRSTSVEGWLSPSGACKQNKKSFVSDQKLDTYLELGGVNKRIQEPSFFQSIAFVLKIWNCQNLEISNMGLIFHIFTIWHYKFAKLKQESLYWHPLIYNRLVGCKVQRSFYCCCPFTLIYKK